MTQTNETPETTTDIEPSSEAMADLMATADDAPIRDLPITGRGIAFPSIV